MAKKLKEEDLEKVNGGTVASPDYIPLSDRGKHITKYECDHYIGSWVYIVNDKCPNRIVKGILLDSYEESHGCGTERVHKIECYQTNARKQGFETWSDKNNKSCLYHSINLFYGDDVTVYLALAAGFIPEN